MVNKIFRKGLLIALFSVVSIFMIAAVGGKGKKKAASASTAKFVNTSKISMTKISLTGTTYQFKNNKFILSAEKKSYTTFTNYTSIQKGNKTVVVASKHTLVKPVISLENNRASINFKLAKISLN